MDSGQILFAILFFSLFVASFYNVRVGAIALLLLSPFIDGLYLFFDVSHSLPLFTLVGAVGLGFLLRFKKSEVRKESGSLALLFGLYLLAILISSGRSLSVVGLPDEGVWSSLITQPGLKATLIIFVGIMGGVIIRLSDLSLSTAVVSLLAGSIAVCFAGFLEYTGVYDPIGNVGGNIGLRELYGWGMHGFFSHKNELGGYLLLVLPIAILRLANRNAEPFHRFLYGGISLLLLICLVATASRTAWGCATLEIIVLLAYFAVRSVREGGRHRVADLLLSSFGIVIFLFLIFQSLSAVPEHIKGERFAAFTARLEPDNMSKMLKENRGRHLYQSVLIFQEYPLIGIGLGNYPHVASLQKLPLTLRNEFQLHGQNPHNYFLLLLTEAGIIGFFPFLFLLARLLSDAFCCLKEAAEDHSLNDRLGLFVGILGYLCTFFSDHTLAFTEMGPLFWGILLLIAKKEEK